MKRKLKALLLGITALLSISQAATISGVITDSSSSAKLEGVAMSLRNATSTIARDTTDAEGAYSFADVAIGNYTVRATKTGYVTQSILDTIAEGDTVSTINIAIAKPVTTTIAGLVTDSAAATALANAVVQLRSGAAGTPVATDTTDAEGKYSFADVVTGEYSVRVSLTDFTTKTVTAAAVSATPVAVDIPLVKTIYSTVTGTVTDSAAATPLANVIISLRRTNQGIATDTTGADGTFSFANVAVGEYTVRGTLTGFTQKSVAANVTSATAVVADIPLVKEITATIEGTVTDSAAATPLTGAVVSLRRANQTIASDTTAADGKYSFANTAAGEYTIRAVLTAYTTKTVNAAITSATAVVADIPLVKAPVTTISGVVSDSTAATPISGAIVQLRSTTATIATDTVGADGKYSFENVPVASYTLRGSFTGFVTKSLNIAMTAAEPVVSNIPLVAIRYGTIAGKITADSAAGAALEGVSVILSRSGAGSVSVDTVTTNAAGSYLFDKVESAQSYTIRGLKSGFSSKSATLMNKSPTADTVNFFLAKVVTKNTSVIVRKAADSTALSGATVALAVSGSINAPIIGTTNASGKTVFDSVVQGTYSISGSAAGFTAVSVNFTVSAASPDSLIMYLAAADSGTKTVTGTITDSTGGKPLANVVVSVRISVGAGQYVTLAGKSSESGTYTIAGIPVATTTISVAAALSEYRSFSKSQIAVGTANKADTTTVDFKMISNAAGISTKRPVTSQFNEPVVRMSRGSLAIHNISASGTIRILSLNGQSIVKQDFTNTHGAPMQIALQHRIAGITVVVKIIRNDGLVLLNKRISIVK